MKIGKQLHFSENYSYLDIKWDEKKDLIEKFKDRVETFYISPAEQLNIARKGFAAGVLCITMIDCLAKIFYHERNKFKKWLKDNIDEFRKKDPDSSRTRTLADRFYEEFRDGLIHEGRIKAAGQFSYDLQDIVKADDRVMEVNPDKLLLAIKNFFYNYLTQIREDESKFYQFSNYLKNDFIKERELARRD